MSRTDKQTNVRLPMELKTWLAIQARQHLRSVTNEIVIRLQESRQRQLAAQKGEG